MGGVSWCLEELTTCADVAQGNVFFDGVVFCLESADSTLEFYTDLVALQPGDF